MQASINYVLSRYSGLEADSEIWTYHLSKHDIFYIYIFPSPADTQIIEKKNKNKTNRCYISKQNYIYCMTLSIVIGIAS